MRRLLSTLLVFICFCGAQASDTLNPVANSAAIVRSGYMRFTVLTPQMIRIQYSNTRSFEDRATFAIVNRNLPVPNFTTKNEGAYLYISTDSMTVRYKKSSQPKMSDKSDVNLCITYKMNGKDHLWYPGKDDALNLKGTTRTLDGGTDDNKRKELENGILSRDGWSIIDESPATLRGDGSQTFAFEKTDDIDWVKQPVNKNATDWYFMGYGHNYKQALGDFVKVAGRIPLPPSYIFGYWYSRYQRYSATDFKNIVNDVEKYNIPMDVMIFDMDWHTAGWTGWTWDKSIIPDPKGLIKWMHNHNLKVSLNLHPADGVDNDEDIFNGMCQDLNLDTKTTTNIPWQLSDKNFYQSFAKNFLRAQEAQGIDFWWIDWQQWLTDKYVTGLGETFWCNHVFFEDMRLNRPELRPVIFHRWGGLGSHRYQIGFSGDSWATFQTLAFQPYFTATSSNVGYGYWGHDLGGHNQSGENDQELYLRWIQYGVFTPIFRTHATNASNIERRIWKFPNFYDMREAVRLRYRLFPYIYTAAREAYDTGVSICRPLYYEFPEEPKAYDTENEYFFGNDILVSPIVTRSNKEGLTQHTVWLPEGKWWNVCRSTLMTGNSTFTDSYKQNEIPYFYKGGSVIVNYPVQRSVESKPDSIILIVVPGKSGKGTFYEDEGNTQNYQDGMYARTTFEQNRTENHVKLTIGSREGSYSGMEQERKYHVEILGVEGPQNVKLNGEAIHSWEYNNEKHVISVSLPKTNCTTVQTIEVETQTINAVNPEEVTEPDYTQGLDQSTEPTKLWIVGSAVPGGVQKLITFPNYQYKYFGKLNEGTFKIINTESELATSTYLTPKLQEANIVNNGIALDYSSNAQDDGWIVSFSDNTYKITVDLSKKTLTGEVCLPWLGVYMVGGCAESGWDTGKMLPFTQSATNPYLWTWTGMLKNRPENEEPKRFKITGQRTWDPKRIQSVTQDELATSATQFRLTNEDTKWSIDQDGFYRVTINLLTEAFKAEYLGTEDGIAPIELNENLQITSSFRTILVRSTENVDVEIYSTDGKKLAHDKGTNVAINMDNAGIYIVKASGETVNKKQKISIH